MTSATFSSKWFQQQPSLGCADEKLNKSQPNNECSLPKVVLTERTTQICQQNLLTQSSLVQNKTNQNFPYNYLDLNYIKNTTQDKADLPEIDRILGDILKQEKQMDCENFQDLESWCSPLATGEFNMDAIDAKRTTTLSVENIRHTTKTHINTHSWDKMLSVETSDMDDVGVTDNVYTLVPSTYTHSPGAGPLIWGTPQLDNTDSVISVDQQTYDINNMEIVYDDVLHLPTPSEGTNSCVQSPGYLDSNSNSPTDKCVQWGDVFSTLDSNAYYTSKETDTTYDTHKYEDNGMALSYDYNDKKTDTYDLEFKKTNDFKEPCNEEMEEIVEGYLLPTRNSVMRNDMIISEIFLNEEPQIISPAPASAGKFKARDLGLTLDTALRQYNLDNDKFQDVVVTTPDVLRTVELLEAENKFNLIPFADCNKTLNYSLMNDYKEFDFPATLPATVEDTTPTILDIEDQTPIHSSILEKSYLVASPASSEEYCHDNYRKRRLSADSDISYTPETEKKQPRKYKKRKMDLRNTETIAESSEKTAKRRGRPPKRRESIISNSTTTDDNISCMSIEELKYRELRDKNNEASRRSRMSRKSKEDQMEALAVELDSKNKELRIKADMLEKLTKRMKDTLMSVILKTS